jgi:hypothetical protein
LGENVYYQQRKHQRKRKCSAKAVAQGCARFEREVAADWARPVVLGNSATRKLQSLGLAGTPYAW